MYRERALERLMDELRDAAAHISDVAELRAYAQKFPFPQAGQVIVEALDYLSEPKIIDGKRDGRRIFQHVNIGYGPRLKGTESLRPKPGWTSNTLPCRDILIAIGLYAEAWSKKHELREFERISNKKLYGVEEPQELIYKFLNLLSSELRKRL